MAWGSFNPVWKTLLCNPDGTDLGTKQMLNKYVHCRLTHLLKTAGEKFYNEIMLSGYWYEVYDGNFQDLLPNILKTGQYGKRAFNKIKETKVFPKAKQCKFHSSIWHL